MDRGELHVSFFPFMAHGHSIPMIDMAKLFAKLGVRTSIITTPVNSAHISKLVEKTRSSGYNVGILIMEFPWKEAGLPEGCENLDLAGTLEMKSKFFLSTGVLARPLQQLLELHRPNCLVSDMFFPWSLDVASRFGIPRVAFNGSCFFSSCAGESVRLFKPHEKVSSDTDLMVIPNLPGEIKLTRKQLPTFITQETEFFKFYQEVKESEGKSYGILVNSFYELEPVYANHYRMALGRKAWHIGPISLWSKDFEDKAKRGKESSISEDECLKWLDSKKPDSILYVCFGSVADFTAAQHMEIAMALEKSGQEFIWVVKKDKQRQGDEEEAWLPEGYEQRMEGKGLIIRGWAPQVMILEHESVGGFVTHCGWNSTLEAITAGVPMVTWPVSAEQFYNEKLVTEVLKIGVGVGTKQWAMIHGDDVKKEAIERAVARVMAGEEAEEMRSRARNFGEMARRAVEEGGSSHSDANAFIEALRGKGM